MAYHFDESNARWLPDNNSESDSSEYESSDFSWYGQVSSANPHFFDPLFGYRASLGVDRTLQRSARHEHWTAAGEQTATGSNDQDKSTREVCLLWRFGGHGQLFDYDRIYEMPGQSCISRLFPRWKSIGRGIYEYKCELGEHNYTQQMQWWMNLHQEAPVPMRHARRPAHRYRRIVPPPSRIGKPILARVRLSELVVRQSSTVPYATLHAWLRVLQKSNIAIHAYYLQEYWVSRSKYTQLTRMVNALERPWHTLLAKAHLPRAVQRLIWSFITDQSGATVEEFNQII